MFRFSRFYCDALMPLAWMPCVRTRVAGVDDMTRQYVHGKVHPQRAYFLEFSQSKAVQMASLDPRHPNFLVAIRQHESALNHVL